MFSFLAGVLCLVQVYEWSTPQQQHPIGTYILTSLGNLLIFTTAYAFINDHFIHRKHIQEIEASLRRVTLDESIQRSGLTEIRARFTDSEAFSAMQRATTVSMLIMRGSSFFRDYHEGLKKCLQAGHLSLHILLPDPNNSELMRLMASKQSDVKDYKEAAQKIANSVNTWIVQKIFAELPVAERKTRLRVSLIDRYPLYSAYLFDNREFWYLPYHYRKDWRPIPLFVYRERLEKLEIYNDFEQLVTDGSTKSCDLEQPIDITI